MQTLIKKQDIRHMENMLFQKGYIRHHIASQRGYTSRKAAGYIEPYSGKFGTGVRWVYPRYDTTRYCYVEYWLYPKHLQEVKSNGRA